MSDLLEVIESGLYCAAGDFSIDPWRPVSRAIVTHAHSDHACAGCDRYLCLSKGKIVLRERVGIAARIDTVRAGESVLIGGVKVSLFPSGHILGAAQVRLEYRGVRWVVTGDYKTQADPTCDPIQTVETDVLVSESTFGLPSYSWSEPKVIAQEINQWWMANRDQGRTSVLLAYSLGKAQRLAAMLDSSIGPIYGHAAILKMVRAYRDSGVWLPPILEVPSRAKRIGKGRGLFLISPAAASGDWFRGFGEVSTAMASGWMGLQSVQQKRGVDRGFVISDHADFSGLLEVIESSRAKRVLLTHGFSGELAHFLCQQGTDASVLPTYFVGESDDDNDKHSPADPPAPSG
ncbi:MAG: ligase-associated DNA damage response exonuclease [Planctomycetota bacterium]|nr:ligase-associated DNA damage response exonuclease [Planctomycetia bacterium]MDO7678942.1 ligase-associated DNA damage response exonuclease [Pirellulales bacterium]